MYVSRKRSGLSFFSYRLVAFIVLALVASENIYSQQTNEKQNVPVVNYLGKSNGQPMVQVDFENKEGLTYEMSVKDPQGNILYSNRFNDSKFSKTFQVAQEEPGDVKLTFTFSSAKSKQSKVIEINTYTSIKNDFLITRL